MKKLLFVTAFLLSTVLPAQASTEAEAEACFNKLIPRPEARPDSAELLYTVEHDGSQYHVIREIFNAPRMPNSRVYIRTDANGGCTKLMGYQEASFPSEQVYKEKLGAEVFAKIRQKAQNLK